MPCSRNATRAAGMAGDELGERPVADVAYRLSPTRLIAAGCTLP
jgi:hypothetical protein